MLCFAYLYYRISGAAAREGLSVAAYMADVFAAVDWLTWIAVMATYSLFYFLIDTLVVSRALSWFIADIKYTDLLPIRGSAYIISIFNEQVGKGAMGYYLNRRHNVPGWEVGSVMLFIMFCEVFYLLVWAVLGYFFSGESLPPAFDLIPYIGAGGAIFLVLWIAFFRSNLLPGLREKRILHAFRLAKPWHYLMFFSPALPCTDRRSRGVRGGLEPVWGGSQHHVDLAVSAGDLLRRCRANTNARCRNHILGHPVPGQRRTDGGVRLRTTQLLYPVQRRHRTAVLAPRAA